MATNVVIIMHEFAIFKAWICDFLLKELQVLFAFKELLFFPKILTTTGEILRLDRCKRISIWLISSSVLTWFFGTEHRLQYSRERAAQSLPKVRERQNQQWIIHHKSCRPRRSFRNSASIAEISVDTAESESQKTSRWLDSALMKDPNMGSSRSSQWSCWRVGPGGLCSSREVADSDELVP